MEPTASQIVTDAAAGSVSYELVGLVVTFVLAIITWWVNAWRARVLQRKQLAVDVIIRTHENGEWTKQSQKVFRAIHEDKTDWEGLANRHYGGKEYKDGEQPLCCNLLATINMLEAIAAAVINKAVDEDIIKWTLRGYFLTLYAGAGAFILESRRILKNDNAYVNFEDLALRWKPTAEAAKPPPLWKRILPGGD
jgi:uncharacterized protein DUF4760